MLSSTWIEDTENRAKLTEEKIQQELSSAKANLVKESVRTGHNELGDFYYQRGDLQVWHCRKEYKTVSEKRTATLSAAAKISLEVHVRVSCSSSEVLA